MDVENSILENTVSYLFKISEALPTNLSIPKSYYASKCRILGLKGGINLPFKMSHQSVRCPRCCLSFEEYPPGMQLKPCRKEDRFTRKMSRKIEEGKNLTCYQQKFCSLKSKASGQQAMVKICRFCGNKIDCRITSNYKKKEKEVHNVTPLSSSKRKKKGKDKYAGLIPSAVLSLNQSKENIKKNVVQILYENSVNQANKSSKIMYNVVGSIEDKKMKKRKKKKQKQNQVTEPTQSKKMKIMERKKNEADSKQKEKISKLLNGSSKSSVSNVLNGFLQTL